MVNNRKNPDKYIARTTDIAVSENDIHKIVESIQSIQFGSVSIIIQNGKIIQIEKNEKIRLV